MSPVPLWTRGCLTDLTLGRAPVVTPPGGWLPSVVVPWATASCVRTASANVPRIFSSTLMGCDPPLSQERAEYVIAYRRAIGYDGGCLTDTSPSWSRPHIGRLPSRPLALWDRFGLATAFGIIGGIEVRHDSSPCGG